MTLQKILNSTSLSISDFWRLYNQLAPHVEYIPERLQEIKTKKTMQNYVDGTTPTPAAIYRFFSEAIQGQIQFKHPTPTYSDELKKLLQKTDVGYDLSKNTLPLAFRRKLARQGKQIISRMVFEVTGIQSELTDAEQAMVDYLDKDIHLDLITLSELVLLPLADTIRIYKKLVIQGHIGQIKPIPEWDMPSAWKDFQVRVKRQNAYTQETPIDEVSRRLSITLSQAGKLWQKAVAEGCIGYKTDKTTALQKKKSLADSYFPQYKALMQENPNLKTQDVVILLGVPHNRVRSMSDIAKGMGLPYQTKSHSRITAKIQQEILARLKPLLAKKTPHIEIYKTLKKQGYEYHHTGVMLRKTV